MKVNEENPLGSEKISRLLHDFALPSICLLYTSDAADD